ncbi:MAG: urease accessory UreF family protein [Betaproteobacteria bacterium]
MTPPASPPAVLATPLNATAAVALTRLLHLGSTMLPIGAYSYSQGLEWAIESGVVGDRVTAECWIHGCLRHSLARFEAPLLVAAWRAWQRGDDEECLRLNQRLIATRESRELLAETLQLGYSLRQWCADAEPLDAGWRARLARIETPAYPVVFAAVAAAWGLDAASMVTVYLWSWLENQVSAALKGVPLGQTDGQRLLLAGAPLIDALAAEIVARSDAGGAQWTTQCPGLAIASACHEVQYSRLFRS